METIAPVSVDREHDGRAQVCASLEMPLSDARRVIRGLAEICGLRAHRLIEWCSPGREGTSSASDLPPLYYAALVPDDAQDEMPLGLGDSPAAALADLLWALGDPVLRSALAAYEPETHDAEAEESPALAETG